MSKPFRFGSAISLATLATAIAGCAAPQKVTGFGGKANGDVGLATRALMALNANDVATAISFAERAVEKTPGDAGFRALLGNAYFAAGRFWSAESAYTDALAIYPSQPGVVLKLALAEIALGKNNEAVKLLQGAQSVLDPADYGLALALAGHAADAVPVLEATARAQGADARVRQNLALAYALAGDWTQARAVAAQDVSANQLDGRIQQWMQLAKPARSSDQVAAVVGVAPAVLDQGQPMRLALKKPDSRLAEAAAASVVAPVAVAEPQVAEAAPPAIPAPQPQFAEAVPASPAEPAAQPQPVVSEAGSPAPLTLAMIAAAAPDAPSAFAAFAPKMPAPAAKPSAAKRTPAPAARSAQRQGNSNAVIQLGSYRSPQQVTAGWSRLTKRYPALRSYLPMRARFDSPNGTFWRLSIQGFSTQREAIARCQLLKSRGGSCFVRGFAGDAPVQYASR
jgi:D-alanyl-D-alanine carboxypeptidase